MKGKMFRDLLILILSGIAVWAILTLVFKDDEFDEVISVQQEEKIGDKVVEFLQKKPDYKKLNNTSLDSAVLLIKARLIEQVGLTDYNYNIVVVENSAINAITLPGGNIFIFKGLVEFADSPDEIAAVVAHEIGHVEKRHIVKKIIREFSVSVLLNGFNTNELLIGDISRTLVSNSFSRKDEEEADEYALKLMADSGIEPYAMASFFRKLNQKYSYNENLEMLYTHPNTNSRIKSAETYELPEGFKSNPILNKGCWERIKASL